MPKKQFFEVDEHGIVYELSRFAGGIAPGGGDVVYAESRHSAQVLAHSFRHGANDLKRTLHLNNSTYKNIIF